MNKVVIITTINYPTKAVKLLAEKTEEYRIPFLIIGDKKTPADFSIKYGDFYNTERQAKLFPEFSKSLPYNHYSRKNIGYLIAHNEGYDLIQETDDDNIPLTNFLDGPEIEMSVKKVTSSLENIWCNVLSYYTSEKIWPRGFPLEEIDSDDKCRIGARLRQINGLSLMVWLIIIRM